MFHTSFEAFSLSKRLVHHKGTNIPHVCRNNILALTIFRIMHLIILVFILLIHILSLSHWHVVYVVVVQVFVIQVVDV